MTRDTRVQIAAVVILGLCVAASAELSLDLTGIAGKSKLAYTDRAEEGQSWEQTVGIAMGAFRGIFVNFLWIRANNMKEAGKFHEAIELASAITKLQPRFPRVWVFHAWNMAYNISVTTQTPQERWAWVNAGIELLRDKGIPANPNDMLIHKELGWIFLHKIGGFTDDANGFYKRELAKEWTIVLGPPPRKTGDDRDRAKAIQKYVDWLTLLDKSPLTLDECIKQEPTVAGLLDKLHSDVGISISSADTAMVMLGQYEKYIAVSKSVMRPDIEKGMGPKTRAFGALVLNPDYAKAWEALKLHLRHRLVVERYHMDVDRMIRYTQKYGPMDWRHHAAHSLYWAEKGIEAGMERWEERNKQDFDFINTDRIVAQSVQDLFRTGEIYFDFLASTRTQNSFFQGVPNPHFVQTYGEILDEMRVRSWADNAAARGTTPLSGGYENFLRDAIIFFYRRNQMDQAEYWRQKLLTFKYMTLNDPHRGDELSQPLSIFVANELQDRLTSPSVMISQVSASLMSAFASGLLGGDQDLFISQFNFAKLAHKTFMEQQLKNTPAGGDVERMRQLDSDFTKMSGGMFFQFMQGLDIDDAQRAYNNASTMPTLQCFAYEPLVQNFKDPVNQSAKENGGKKFDEMFPEPPGYKKFVAQIRAEMEAEQQRNKAKLEQK